MGSSKVRVHLRVRFRVRVGVWKLKRFDQDETARVGVKGRGR